MAEQTPLALATDFTAEFIAANALPGATVLEIGCGAGNVAAELRRRGYAMTAVESDESEARRARSKGLAVIAGEWPDVAAPHVDVVVFTRSLHHVKEVDRAL